MSRNRPEDQRRRTRSSATAATMIAPVMISCTQLSTPSLAQPLSITVISKAPASVPTIEPSPPDRLAPPITTAAMTSSSRPCAVVGSRLRLGWSSRLDDVWSQSELVRDFLSPHRAIIESARTPLEQTAVLWCVENLVPLAQLQSQPWHVCAYEHLRAAPDASIADLFHKLNLEPTRSTRRAVAAQVSTPPSSSKLRDTPWYAPLSESEGERVLEICAAFGIHLYGRDRLPLCDPRKSLLQCTECR